MSVSESPCLRVTVTWGNSAWYLANSGPMLPHTRPMARCPRTRPTDWSTASRPGGRGQDVLGRGEQRLPRLAQLDAPGGADEQRCTQVVFKGTDGGGQGGLCHATAEGGTREVPFLGHGHELFQLSELH